jgi:hypothetical protein
MNLALGALLPPVYGGHSALKPEMIDSSVLASAVLVVWRYNNGIKWYQACFLYSALIRYGLLLVD